MVWTKSKTQRSSAVSAALYSLDSHDLTIFDLYIGQKSLKEIKRQFFEECYQRLLPYEKAHYWQEVLDAKSLM